MTVSKAARYARKKDVYVKKTDREFEDRLTLPSPGKYQWFALPGEAFNFAKFSEYIYGSEKRGRSVGNDYEIQKAKIEHYIRTRKTAQARYLVYLCMLGKLCQDAIRILETQRRLEVKELSKFVKIGSHAAFKTDKVPGEQGKNITDTNFIVWRTALGDTMFEIKSLLVSFVATYQLTEIPDYSMFPNPEQSS
jgi:hypothetical protein